jgi:hypothetical protein
METKKAAVIIRNINNQWEGLRSSLGLGVQMIDAHMFVIGEVQMPEDRFDGYKENLEFLKDDLEAKIYTDNEANVEKWGFFEYMSLDNMGKKLFEYDLIIPF